MPPARRLLFLKLRAQNERERFAFCSVKGCERIRIKALIPKNAGVSDCTATAYPRFAEKAVVDVPMPRKLRGAQLVSASRHGPAQTPARPPIPWPGVRGGKACGRPSGRARGSPHPQPWRPVLSPFQKTKDRFLEVKMESSRQRFFHLLSDVAYVEVSGAGWPRGGWWHRPGVVTDGRKPGCSPEQKCVLPPFWRQKPKLGGQAGLGPPGGPETLCPRPLLPFPGRGRAPPASASGLARPSRWVSGPHAPGLPYKDGHRWI